MRTTARWLAAVVFTAALLPDPARAQVEWSRTTSLGYATAGTAIGIVGFWNHGYSVLTTAPLGLAAGAWVGHWIGESAERRLQNSETLSGIHANAVRLGSVMAGAGVGAVGAALYINYTQSPTLSDENVFAGAVATGAALGLLYQLLHEDQLRPPSTVRTSLGVSPEGAAVLGLQLSF